MTSLRKWRFPILIGSGLIAAGILFYFSNAHVGSDKTQGAIGQRDVYRDGQVNSADVARPGSAPVATTAILESSEFKSLAKNEAFQQLLKDGSFAEMSRQAAFMQLLSDKSFQEMARNGMFAQLVSTQAFQQALRQNMLANLHPQDARFNDLTRSDAFAHLANNAAFQAMARNQAFANLLSSNAFRQSMAQPAFMSLLAQPAFQAMLVNGTGFGPGWGFRGGH